MILETERLMLRELEQSDYADLAEMLQNSKVVYAYEHDFTDEDVQAWLDRQRGRYEKYGFGLWAMVLKESGRMIGLAGLTMQPHPGGEVLEIGYLLKHDHWHRGYAHEAANACKEYAFSVLGADKVHSVIKADNHASQRVAEGIGMSREEAFMTRYYSGDRLHWLYSVRRQQTEDGKGE